MTSPHSLPQPSQDTVMNDKRTTEMCGGCGNDDPAQRCLGCLHEFTPAAKPVPEHISDERLAVRPTEDITIRLDNLAQSLAGEYPPHTLMDLAEAASLIATMRTELQHRREAEAGILAQDVIDLVIAARMVAYEDQSPEAIRALDKAAEAFAERVGWENDPDALAASPSSPASGVRVIGYVTEEALKLMLTVKPKSGWHYHMFAKDQADAEATIAIYASDAEALSALGEHP